MNNLTPIDGRRHGGDLLVSIVSHGHGEMVQRLLQDLERELHEIPARVVLTLNIPEELPFDETMFRLDLRIIKNSFRSGFGANHNKAFAILNHEAPCAFFCVLNPDVRFPAPAFGRLIETARGIGDLGAMAPIVRSPSGGLEDNARSLPTPGFILLKALKRAPEPTRVDWLAGMFLLVPATSFIAVGGFDERYFLYYEDVDFCCRLRTAGYRIVLHPDVYIVHEARRESHKRIVFFSRHLVSLVRFFSSNAYRQARRLSIEPNA